MKEKQYPTNKRGGIFTQTTLSTIVAAFTLVAAQNAKAIDWDGGGDGISFGDAANWAGDAVPDATQEAALGANSATMSSSAFAVDWVSATSGSLTMTGGSVTMDYAAGFGANFGTADGATLTMSGSSLITMSNMNIWRIGSGSYSGTVILDMSDDAAIVRNGGSYLVLGNGNFAGTMSGNSSISSDASEFFIGDSNGNAQTATLDMSDASSISVTGGRLLVGQGALTNTTINLNDTASISITSSGSVIGAGGTGTINLYGSSSVSNTSTDAFVIASGGGTGTVNLYGSSTFDAEYVKVGDNGASALVTINDSASMNVADLTIGHYAGTAASGTVDVNGASASLEAGNIIMGRDDSAGGAMSGYLNINGGTVITNSIQHGGGDAGTAQVVTVDAGTIQAASDTTEFFSDTASPSSNIELMVNIAGGGMTFDTAGFNVATAQSFTGDGGMTKAGEGTLTLSGESTFAGGMTVLEGTLSLESAAALTSSSILDLASNVAFEMFYGDDNLTISALLVDGVDTGLTGTFTAAQLAAEISGVTITGDSASTLTIGAIPEPSVVALSGLMLLGLLRRSRRA